MNENSNKLADRPGEHEELIEAGEVQGLDGELHFHEAKHRAETSRLLAIMFVWVLALSFFVHYVTTALVLVLGNESTAESLSKIFNVWLPVMSGLMGSAATYYFTKEK